MHHTPVLTTLATAVPPGSEKTLLTYIAESREVGLLIIVLSLFVTAVIITQLFSIRLGRLAPDDHIDNLDRLLAAHDVRGAIEYCEAEGNRSFLTRVLGGALIRCARSPFGYLELKNAVEELGEQEVARLQRMTDIVGLVASIAPMLGLLGTVVGMVGAFDTISTSRGPSGPTTSPATSPRRSSPPSWASSSRSPAPRSTPSSATRSTPSSPRSARSSSRLTTHIEHHQSQPAPAPAAQPPGVATAAAPPAGPRPATGSAGNPREPPDPCSGRRNARPASASSISHR